MSMMMMFLDLFRPKSTSPPSHQPKLAVVEPSKNLVKSGVTSTPKNYKTYKYEPPKKAISCKPRQKATVIRDIILSDIETLSAVDEEE